MLTTSKLVEKLKSNFFFKKAPDVAASLGSLKSNIAEVSEGKIVFQNGEVSDNVYLILYGLVKIKIKTKTGAKIISRAAGDFFGEREVLEGKERTSTAITEIDSEFFVISRERFISLLYGNSEIKINVKINLAKTYDLTKEGAEAIIDNNEPGENQFAIIAESTIEANEPDEEQFAVVAEPEAAAVPIPEPEEENIEEIEEYTPVQDQSEELKEEESEDVGIYDDFDFEDDEEEFPDFDEDDEEEFPDYEDDDFEIEEVYEDDFESPEEKEFVRDIDKIMSELENEESPPLVEPRLEIEEPDYDALQLIEDDLKEEEPYFEEEGDFPPLETEIAGFEDSATVEEFSDETESPTDAPPVEKITIVNSGEVAVLKKKLELVSSICRVETPVEIFELVKDEVMKMVNAKEFVMFVFDGGFLTSVTGHKSEDTNFAVREKIAYELITMQEPVTLFDLDSSGMMEGLEGIDENEIPSSLLYYPLIGKENKVNGCFLFFSSNNGRFTTNDVMSLEEIATVASGILDKISDGKTSLTGKYEDLQKYTAFFGSEIKIAVETILSVSETLDRGKLTDKVRYGFDIIRERAAGLKGFLDSIQFFVGKVSGFSKQPYLVSELLDDFLVKVSEPAKQREVTLLRKYNADMVMFFNKELFIHALTLITQNSFDAMPEGGKIYFSTSANESNILISIRDTGSGIHPDLREKIFEPFYTYGKTGVGLGLPIANKIIKEHGGFIYLESSKTHGTEIIIALPV